MWATPNVPNGGRAPSEGMSPTGMLLDGRKRQVGLEWQTRRFPPDLESETPGAPRSPSGPNSRRRLNPLFVEWLMGWPIGWTACEPLGTEWSRWLRLSRSWLSQLVPGS